MRVVLNLDLRQWMFWPALVGMLTGTYLIVVMPHAHARHQAMEQMRQMDEQIAAVQRTTSALDEIAREVDETRQTVDFFSTRLIDEDELPKVFGQITKMAAANSLQVAQAEEALPASREAQANTRPLRLHLAGDFNGFYAFLLQLESMPQVSRITRLSVRSGVDRQGNLDADLSLALYLHIPGEASVPSDGAGDSKQLIRNFLENGSADLTAVRQMIQTTDTLMQACNAGPQTQQIALANLRANPFDPQGTSQALASIDVHQDDSQRIAMLQEVEKMQVQSVVSSGQQPTCVIDNRFYHEGQQVGAFTIERIGGKEVVIRSGGYRFELKVAG